MKVMNNMFRVLKNFDTTDFLKEVDTQFLKIITIFNY